MHDDTSPDDKLSDVSVHAGFPNPAADTDRRASGLSLDQLLFRNPSSTYLFRLKGHAWEADGIGDGDVAVVDRACTPRPSDLVITWHGDDFLLMRKRFLPAHVVPWGVVTAVIHQYRQEGA